nr:FHA domain-containing protein [Pseudenhygromyxa sp. WMMC2535]
MRTGQRQLAYTLLLEHTRDPHAARPGQAPSGLDEGTSGVGEVSSTALVAARHDIERRLLRGRALGLLARELEPSERHGAPTALRIFGRERLRLGRGPECELPARGAALSRTHAELLPQRPQPDEDSVLVLRDLASRAGTFIDGQALAPGEPWPLHPYGDEPLFAELGLGIAASFELWTLPDPAHPSALVRDARFSGEPSEGLERAWTLFAPHGGPLWLHPERRLPLSLRFAEDHVVLTASPEIQITLDHTPVGAGVSVELLVGDRLRVEGRGMGAGVELEILEVWS